jgi:hypothetical protein
MIIKNTFCSNCGAKIDEGAQFCQNCGFEIDDLSKKVKSKVSKSFKGEPLTTIDEALFYSEEWDRAKCLAISSVPHFDILITKENLYLIHLPKTHGGTFGFFLGFIFFSPLGALIGSAIGNSSDRNKRKERRSTWIDSNRNLISQEYENNLFLKIPRGNLKSCLSLEKNKFIVLAQNDKTITLKKNKKEYERFNKYIESYVL